MRETIYEKFKKLLWRNARDARQDYLSGSLSNKEFRVQVWHYINAYHLYK